MLLRIKNATVWYNGTLSFVMHRKSYSPSKTVFGCCVASDKCDFWCCVVLLKLHKEYLNLLKCKSTPYSRWKTAQFDVWNTFLCHAQKKLFTVKNSPVFFGPPCTSQISQKRCILGIKLLQNTNKKPHAIYRMVPLSMTLSDLWPRFQSCDIFRHWISQKRHEIKP